MKSIDLFFSSMPKYEAMKKPFDEKIEDLESQKAIVEEELEELESKLSDLEDDISEQEEEIRKIDDAIKKAYQESLSEPKRAIHNYLSEQVVKGDLNGISIEHPTSISEVIITVPMKRLTVVFSYPAIAKTKDDCNRLYITLTLKESTQPWQIKQIVKILKREFLANMGRDSGAYSFYTSVSFDKIPETIYQQLCILNKYSQEIDGHLTYSFDPSEII